MKEYFIMLEFESVQCHAQIMVDLQQHFRNVTVVCDDCLKVYQYMREAYRGVLTIRHNRKMSRAPIVTVEKARNRNTQLVIEIILTHDNIPINVQLYDRIIRFKFHSDSSKYAENFKNLLSQIFPNASIVFITNDAKFEALGFFADVERWLNDGDILGGEVRLFSIFETSQNYRYDIQIWDEFQKNVQETGN